MPGERWLERAVGGAVLEVLRFCVLSAALLRGDFWPVCFCSSQDCFFSARLSVVLSLIEGNWSGA